MPKERKKAKGDLEMRQRVFVLFSILYCVTPSSPQTCYFLPDSNASSGKVNQIPFGGKGPTGPFQNVKYQLLIPASSLGTRPGLVTSIWFASPEKGSYHFKSLEVSLGFLKGKTLSSTYLENMDKPVVVLDKSDWFWVLDKADSWCILPIEGKFYWDGRRDIVLQVITQGSSCSCRNPGFRRSSTLLCVYTLGFDPRNPAKKGYGPISTGLKIKICIGKGSGGALKLTGRGCRASNGKVPEIHAPVGPSLGKSFTVQLLSAPKSIQAILLAGNRTDKLGSVSLPLDLKKIGAAGCFLYTNIIHFQASQTNISGFAHVDLAIPDVKELKGMSLHLQWLLIDGKANDAGIALTALGTAGIH